jgi:hypothetical protein
VYHTGPSQQVNVILRADWLHLQVKLSGRPAHAPSMVVILTGPVASNQIKAKTTNLLDHEPLACKSV